MMVGMSQITICWHVDNLKISHRDKAIVSEFTMVLADEFGLKTTISGGKVYDYFGMDFGFGTCLGMLIISMIKYLHKIIDEFSEVLRGAKVCPVRDNISKVRDDEDMELLNEEMLLK